MGRYEFAIIKKKDLKFMVKAGLKIKINLKSLCAIKE